MKAEDLIKAKGIDKAVSHLQCYGWRKTPFIIKLKRLVESHELVEFYGGVNGANGALKTMHFDVYTKARLKQAIADVESCMEVS